MSRAGSKLLYDHGLIEEVRAAPDYGPRNSLFLAHELMVRDVRVWLELCARGTAGHELAEWRDGADAEIDLKRTQTPKLVRPDAWFVYRLGVSVLVGLVEVDRGTEQGGSRWKDKLAAYQALYQSNRLQATTGYANARVLVVTPGAGRRDSLAQFIHAHARPELAGRFWLADSSILAHTGLGYSGWRQATGERVQVLISSEQRFQGTESGRMNDERTE